ncbi:unnamed protein product [Rhizophagus irregularis]|uniref:HTH CENPB-type domain-containing protein n=1 Tax=Rhizophagus irregularis TaxID=588596 RepID=A0A915Z445_9GLOM|nr:unnamed protein product [Rhizophagus irregularis]
MSLKRTTLTEIQKVNESTITRILQTTERRLGSETISPNTKRHKPVTYLELELALKEFVLDYQHRTVLSDALLIEKAKMIADGLDIPRDALQFSSGWLHKFKDRNGIRQRKLEEEASSADEAAIANALPLLRERCSNYPLERIYNMDKTGLFYRLEPDRTLATKRLAGPLIIGKFEKPRCFKNIKIQSMPMTYRNNAKAWMITSLFQEWIWEFDHQVGLKHQGQRMLLLLDNCSSHKLDGLTLRYTDVHFLPPNTTSKIQPMDAGVIMSFKRHYHRSHVRLLLRYVEAGEINPEVVRNCWWHTKILPDDVNVDLRNVSEDIRQNENLVLDELADALRDLNLPYPMQAEEFLNLPEENIVYKVPEDDKIIEELVYLFKNTDKENTDLEEIDDSDEIPVISTSTAIASLETVRMFLLQQENAEEYVKLVGKIEKFFRVKKTNSLRQTDINAYFH